MLFMNEHEIDEAVARHRDKPVLSAATATLVNLRRWTNANSDGWPYWAAPVRAAERLMTLILDARGDDDADYADFKRALTPIRSFRTKHGADFLIVLPLALLS